MIATGTDVRPLECVFFMRSVKSRTYFEQMKGRGVRVIGDTDFQAVTPDALAKDRFVIVDAVGVTETDLVETQPLDRQPTVALDKLFKQLSFGSRDPDLVSTIAGRLARLDRRLTKEDREELEELAGGVSLQEIARGIVEALDPDHQREATGKDDPTAEEIAATAEQLLDAAVEPLATNPELRERIVEVRRSYEQAIDETSKDRLIEAGYSKDATDRARATVESFERFIEEHKDEITALQILYSRPYAQRLTFREIKELANAIGRPPYQWTPEKLWAGVRGARPLEGARLRRARADRHRLARALRAAPGRRARAVPRARARALRGVAAAAGERGARRSRPSSSRGSSGSATTSPRRSGSRPTTSRTRRSSSMAGSARRTQVFGDELAPLLDELNEALGSSNLRAFIDMDAGSPAGAPGHGSGVTASKTEIRQPIFVPPLNEQRRIVAAIEEQFSRLDAAERASRPGPAQHRLQRRARTRIGLCRRLALDDARRNRRDRRGSDERRQEAR